MRAEQRLALQPDLLGVARRESRLQALAGCGVIGVAQVGGHDIVQLLAHRLLHLLWPLGCAALLFLADQVAQRLGGDA